MHRWILVTVIAFFAVSNLQAQAPAPATPAKPAVDPTQLAVNWVDQYNALSQWYLSYDGKEDAGIAGAIKGMMDILAPDVIAQVPPHDPEQIGPVMLVGKDQVRKWLEKIAKTTVQISYKIQRQTEDEADGEIMVHSKVLPWGGVSVSFQVFAAYSDRESRQRFLELGAAFVQYGEDGKVHRFRLIQSEKKLVEDTPDDQI